MKRFGPWVLMVSVLVWGLNFAPALAAHCEDGELPTGALYRICLPDSWNGRLLVYAPGYVSPLKDLAIPEDQLVLPDGTSIPELVTDLGYAFAVTSFRDNGLVVLEGLADLEALVEKFKAGYRNPSRIYLVGVSQGGLMATLAAEGRASGFDGALSCCAAIGDFPRQINYWGDVRVIFDYFFPGVLPGSPVDIPGELQEKWYGSGGYLEQVTNALISNSDATRQLLAVTRVPPGPNPESRLRAVTDNLWYNVFATNDAIDKLKGQPYDNKKRWYFGSDNDLLLNRMVQRFRADPTALEEMKKYQTSGGLQSTLVTLHTTQDHVVPYWHELLYGNKVLARGVARHYLHVPVFRWGHCNFKAAEVLAAFALLTLKVEGLPLGGVQAALPDPEAQETFENLLKQHRLRYRPSLPGPATPPPPARSPWERANKP